MNKIIHILFHLRNLMIAFLLQFLYIVCGVDLSGDHFYKIGWPWLWYYRHIPYSLLRLPYAEVYWLNLAGVLLLGWLVLSLAESLLERMNMRYPRWRRYFSVFYSFMVGVPAVTALVCWGRYLFGFYVPRPVPTICVLLVLFLLLLLAVFAVGEILWKLWDKIRYGDRALLWGGCALVASCVLWSGNYVLGKLMMSRAGVSAGEISFWRFAAAGLLMFSIACAARKKKVFALTRRTAFEVAGQGMLGMCLVGLLMFRSEKLTSAINASMLDALIPVTILIGGFLAGRKLTTGQCVGMAISLSGCLLVIRVVTPEGIQLTRLGFADLLIVAAAACWAGYVLWGKETLKRVDSLVYTAWAMIAGATATLFFCLLFDQPLKPPLDPEVLVLLAVLIAGPTVGAFWLWNIAARDVPLPLLNITQYLIPVCAILFAHFLLGEPLGGWQTAGMFLIAGGVALDPAVLGSLKRAAARLKKRL